MFKDCNPKLPSKILDFKSILHPYPTNELQKKKEYTSKQRTPTHRAAGERGTGWGVGERGTGRGSFLGHYFAPGSLLDGDSEGRTPPPEKPVARMSHCFGADPSS